MTRKSTDTYAWDSLWFGIHDLSETFEERLVFIGGVAVFLHVKAAKLAGGFVEFSHDGDFYISRSDFADLSDIENITANRRLSKYQIVKKGMSFDIYLENNNTLIVRFADISHESLLIEDVRVACLEHLLILKLDAYRDRKNTSKGAKDERDLIRIMHLLNLEGLEKNRLEPYLSEEDIKSLLALRRSDQFLVVCNKNAHMASQVRTAFNETTKRLAEILT